MEISQIYQEECQLAHKSKENEPTWGSKCTERKCGIQFMFAFGSDEIESICIQVHKKKATKLD